MGLKVLDCVLHGNCDERGIVGWGNANISIVCVCGGSYLLPRVSQRG